MHFPQEATLQHTLEHHLAPLRFVDDHNSVTEEYPFNPSGSSHGGLVYAFLYVNCIYNAVSLMMYSSYVLTHIVTVLYRLRDRHCGTVQ